MVKDKRLAFLTVSLLLFSWSVCLCSGADRAAVDVALADAEGDLASAHVAVVEAEASGADVSGLLVRVEAAVAFLADAHNAYRLGDFDSAYLYAQYCIDEVDGIAGEASGLKLEAEDAYGKRLFLTAAVSSVVLSVFFVLSLVCWRFLKASYLRRVLEMRPEVVKAE